MYCPNCGQELTEGTKFCWECGTDIQKATTSSQSPRPTTTSNKPVLRRHCPICSKNDQIAKVSAIVSGQTHQISGTTQEWVSDKDGSGYWSTVPVIGTQISGLAQKLSPPPQPSYSVSFWWYLAPFLAQFNLLFIWFAPMSKSSKLVLAGLMGLILLSTIPGERSSTGYPIPLVIAILVGSLIWLIGFYVAISREKARQKVKLKAEDIPIWEKAMNKWDSLYYCARDDRVFDPSTGESASIDRMTELLYR